MTDHSTAPTVIPPTSTSRASGGRSSVQHAPLTPSRLREAMAVSPDDSKLSQSGPSSEASPTLHPRSLVETEPIANEEHEHVQGNLIEPTQPLSDARTRLLEAYHRDNACGSNPCNHGTFSPRAQTSSASSLIAPGDHDTNDQEGVDGPKQKPPGWFDSSSAADLVGGVRDTSAIIPAWLAAKSGFTNPRLAYVAWYFPGLKWMQQYQWRRWFRGDLIAALTMASFYIPMSLSYASNLGHVPAINGLYSFVFNPIIYAFLGTCPQMVVGPEAAGSLLVGTVVSTCIDRGTSSESDDVLNAQIAGVVTGIAGAVIFVAGLTRLGFLDSVLSRPFLRGFISAIGFVILVDQLIPELGLSILANEVGGVVHGSSAVKMVFLVKNIGQSHALTTAVSFTSFFVIMIFRTLKTRLQPRYPSVAYFPDRFLVVALSAILAWQFEWDKRGLAVLGQVKTGGSKWPPFHWPFQFHHVKHIDTAMSTAFLIALLGFFESSVAAKSLGEGTHGLEGISLSANRELIALGAANIVGGFYMALPAFGGYGRSKVNASTGGTTPMSSILLSAITLLCVLFLLPAFYYLPKGVLSAMISVVAYSLIEECPHDLRFFIRIRGWVELFLMAVIFLSTILYSLSLGIALGIGLSLLQLIRHATKVRIQILGRIPGTDRFENAELIPERVEYIDGCLIVKIPEPLTFANTGQLKSRLQRLEHYGEKKQHPSAPRTRPEDSNKNIIFDVHGVTSIDGSGTQALSEIVEDYVKKGRRVFFCRLPVSQSSVLQNFERSGIIDICGGRRNFVGSVDQALRLSEIQDLQEYFDAARETDEV